MAVSSKNTRIILTINKEIKQKLKDIADKEQRSVSNLCQVIVSDYINKKEQSK